MSGADARKFPRYALEAEVQVETEDGPVEGRTRNLSRGGLCAILESAVQVGAEHQVKVALVFDTDTFSEPLEVFARVVWCTAMGDGYQVGVQWKATDLDNEQRSYLEMFLRFLEEGANAVADEEPEADDSDPFAS